MKTKNLRPLLCDFFLRNPDEELTTADVQAKFGCPRESAARMMRACFEDGALRRWRIKTGRPGGEYVYRAGPALIGGAA